MPCGIPNLLFSMPEYYTSYSDQKTELDLNVINSDHCQNIMLSTVEVENLNFQEWALHEMLSNGWKVPHTRDEALNLYGDLLSKSRR